MCFIQSEVEPLCVLLGLTDCRIGQARNFHLPQLILVLNRLGISTDELDSSNWPVGKFVGVFF